MSLHVARRPTWARVIITAAVLALAGLLLADIPGGSARAAATHPGRAATVADDGGRLKPTVVLEHGAWADSGSWNAVTALLQAAGYTVDARPTRCAACPMTPATWPTSCPPSPGRSSWSGTPTAAWSSPTPPTGTRT